MPEDPAADLFDRMVAEGHAAFTLAALDAGLVPAEGREQDLVAAAVTAGVVGALSVIRGTMPDGR